MLRPEVVKQLECPSVGLATSWAIGRKSVPCDSLQAVRADFSRKYWPFPKGAIAKSNGKATGLREQGNAAYKQAPNDPDRTLQLYNQSICMAEEGSKELGLGYANRSAIYFNRKQYRECLENIDLARRHNYPEELMKKLNDREKRSKQMMEGLNDPSRGDDNNTRHCSIKSCLELSADGKGIRTKRDLSVGEKVLLEKPFLLVVEPEWAYQRCDYCGARNALNLLPCSGCTAVMYCSVECREQSYQRYHQFECEIVDDLQLLFRGPKATRMFHVTLRLFWHAVLLFLEDPEGFGRRIKNADEQAAYRNPFALEPTDYVLHLHAVCPEEIPRPDDPSGRTGRCVSQLMSVLMYVLAVEENVSVASRLQGTGAAETLLSVLFRFTHHTGRLMDEKMDEQMTCFYPFARLLRHSCAPNAERVMHGVQTVVVLKRPVARGQEITVANDEKLTIDRASKAKREEIRNKYEAVQLPPCDCEACKFDYPELAALEGDEKLAQQLQAIQNEQDEGVKQQALVDFMQRHAAAYPKRELADAWKLYRPYVTKDL
uniref:MYND-type domain-containing protein n=1 Tax=Anopheles dirus TaxID=7168 RepID=A0A182N3X8_9DIPT